MKGDITYEEDRFGLRCWRCHFTLVAQKVATLLDANGYADKYEIVQCAISEAKDACDEAADLLIATTVAPEGLTCPYVSGVPFMTGMNRVAAEKAVLDVMAQ